MAEQKAAHHTAHKAERSGGIENAVKLVGESVLPGASLLMDGQILKGGAHVVVGALAGAALGPLGLLLTAANSYSTSATGKNLIKQFSDD